jgi:hypothetical protein
MARGGAWRGRRAENRKILAWHRHGSACFSRMMFFNKLHHTESYFIDLHRSS